MQPLTDEQRKFAEEYAGLIWRFIRRHNLGFGNPELQNDWYGELAEAYLVAVKKYHPEVGPFSNFANGCMWRHMKSRLHLNNLPMRTRMITVSIDAPISAVDDRTLNDIVPDCHRSVEEMAIEHVFSEEMLTQIWPVLTDKLKAALRMRAYYEDDFRGAAARLNIKPDAFRARIFQARRRINESGILMRENP